MNELRYYYHKQYPEIKLSNCMYIEEEQQISSISIWKKITNYIVRLFKK